MEKLIIDRSTWYRGLDGDDSMLRNEQGQMCCLGFYALQRGYTRSEIACLTTPSDLANSLQKNLFPEWLVKRITPPSESCVWGGTNTACLLMQKNDEVTHPELAAKKEQDLIRLFAENGVQVEFVGETPADLLKHQSDCWYLSKDVAEEYDDE